MVVEIAKNKKYLIILSIIILIYIVSFSVMSILKHYTFHSTAYDLSIADYELKHISNGEFNYINEISDELFEFHFRPINFLLVPFYWLYPHVETLLIIQSLLLGIGALPIYLLLTVEGIPTIDRASNTSIILSKFSRGSESLRDAMNFSLFGSINFIIMMTLHVTLYLYNRNSASIVCMYILIHMLKAGGTGTILITPLYFLFLLISINSIRFKWVFPSKGANI